MATAATARESRVPLFEKPDPLDEEVRQLITLPRRTWKKLDEIATRETVAMERHVPRSEVIARMVHLQIRAYEMEQGEIPVRIDPVTNGRKALKSKK